MKKIIISTMIATSFMFANGVNIDSKDEFHKNFNKEEFHKKVKEHKEKMDKMPFDEFKKMKLDKINKAKDCLEKSNSREELKDCNYRNRN